MFLNSSFVHRFGRPDRNLLPVDFDGLFQMDGIDTVDGFMQRAFRAQEPHFFGFKKEFIPEIRMCDADQGHGPLLEAFTE